MGLIFNRYTSQIHAQQAVATKSHLPKKGNKANDVRFVQNENTHYIYNGYAWQEVNLILE